MNEDEYEALLTDLPPLLRREPGDPLKPGEVEVPTLPLPPPRDRDDLDMLLLAMACTPIGASQLITDTVEAFDDPGAVANMAHDALFELPSRDVGRHLTLLSLLGGMRHASSMDPLERFVWLDDAQVYGAEPPDRPGGETGSAGSLFPAGGVLQARAVEMLIWASGGDYLDGTRRVLQDHPSTAVRVAAIDAHLYSRNDHPDAVDELSGIVRDQDRWAVGLPRRSDYQEPAAFDAALARRRSEFDSEPPPPGRAADSNGGN